MSTRQNAQGQGISHATGDSKVPGRIQEFAPKSVEDNLPESIHPTGSEKGKACVFVEWYDKRYQGVANTGLCHSYVAQKP